MRKSAFTEEQIAYALREAESGTLVLEVCRKLSTTDPDATPLRLKGGGIHLGYQTHYVVDGGKRRIILSVLVTPGEVMENQPMLDLAWHVRSRFQLRPQQATGDTTYGTLKNISALEREDIRAPAVYL
jgi:hypothetical protein